MSFYIKTCYKSIQGEQQYCRDSHLTFAKEMASGDDFIFVICV